MTRSLRQTLRKGDSDAHVREFGGCVGIVIGPVDYGTQQGPEVDVRWLPSRLRYAYDPKELKRVNTKIRWKSCRDFR